MNTVLENNVLSSTNSGPTTSRPRSWQTRIESERKMLHTVNPASTGIEVDSSELELRKYTPYEEFQHVGGHITLKWTHAEPFFNPNSLHCDNLVHSAAYCGDLRVLEKAVALNGLFYEIDECGRCPLHYAAHQGHVNVIKKLFELDAAEAGTSETGISAHPQLSLRDYLGRTPLHEAVEGKHVEVVRLLVQAGANVNAPDENGVPPLFLAYSGVDQNQPDQMKRYENIVDILISANASNSFIHPETETVLHHAVKLGSPIAIARLLNSDGNPNCMNGGANNPLHLAAILGNHETLCALLENVPRAFVNIPNMAGLFPLHLAAIQGNLDCVRTLVDYGGDLAKKAPDGNTVIDVLTMIKHDADLVVFFTDILDTKVHLADKVVSSAQIYYEFTLDFQMLAPDDEPQMAVVSALIKAVPRMEQSSILQHPVLNGYLDQKWSRVKYFFYSIVAVHVLFVMSLTAYVIALHYESDECDNLRRIMLFSAVFPFCQNLMYLIADPRRYCKKYENWLSLICVTLSIAVAVAGEFVQDSMCTKESSEIRYLHPSWTRHSLSISILLAWIKIVFLAGQFPAWGFYALIFFTVLKNVLKVLLIGIWIIIGFTLSFTILFPGEDQFKDPFKAFVKTVVMFTGEFDYDDLFAKNNSTFYDFNANQNRNTVLPITSRIVFLLFVMLAGVVLMNLTIGLAVSDIQDLVREGQFSRLVKQTKFIANCERMTTDMLLWNKLIPLRLSRMLKSTIETKRNVHWYWGNGKHPSICKNLFKLGAKNRDSQKRNRSLKPRMISSSQPGTMGQGFLPIRQRLDSSFEKQGKEVIITMT